MCLVPSTSFSQALNDDGGNLRISEVRAFTTFLKGAKNVATIFLCETDAHLARMQSDESRSDEQKIEFRVRGWHPCAMTDELVPAKCMK